MIPLSYFLIAWFVFLGFYAIMALISLLQMVRLGVSGSGTYISAVVFLSVVLLVILGTGGYFLTVDWNQGANLFGSLGTSPYLNP